MNFDQWVIEIRNNLTMISEEAKRQSLSPEKIGESNIKTIFDMVHNLEQMYSNLRGLEESDCFMKILRL